MSNSAQAKPKYARYIAIVAVEASNYFFAPEGAMSKGDGNPGTQKVINPGSFNVPNVFTVTYRDPDGRNQRQRTMRYIAGCETIWQDEQIKMGYGIDYRYSDDSRIIFEMGELIVFPDEKPSLYQFMELCPVNTGSPYHTPRSTNLFYRDNKEAEARQSNELSRVRARANSIVLKLEHDTAKLHNVCKLLGYDMTSDPETLLKKLYRTAQDTPNVIVDAFSDNAGDVAELIWDAIEMNIIQFTGFGWEYVETKEKITVPDMRGRQREDVARRALINYLQTEDGNSVREMIQTLVTKRKK
jgi:hypothetical protein